MELLSGVIRAYPWGSRTAIAKLRGEQPSASPEAELWFGAHPGGSSLLNGKPLIDCIAEDPESMLGPRVLKQYGENLPFLLKILAANEPLSLQAHPSREQAIEGFARENQAGIAIQDPTRNYKDDNHKPELIVALTEFEAMAGFRPLAETAILFDALACPELERYRTMLIGAPADEEANLRALFTTWITIPTAARNELIGALVDKARAHIAGTSEHGWIEEACKNLIEIANIYPGDVGVLGALLLNKLTLQPGEAIYLDAGQLHAYVRGMGVEIMANCDNVLRGGLTSKYVDVPELVKVLKFQSLRNIKLQTEIKHGWVHYPVPTDEFTLASAQLVAGEEKALEIQGPTILLCTSGKLVIEDKILMPTEALWVPAQWNKSVSIQGIEPSNQVFVASV
ncbi:mannose-6-phosphate isomerase, class I [Corynebacterium freiburgense]|uniref:mannose-6-phosphate isomerase, class I n=1 Tax=Corynebacterium freiburgense TaxID=556548 RepID=UPI00042833CC|nr:mannose-6-phosphate isomerase, class I [Corynebacterium freiburgense]WJZ01909.1 Mannose-6-phosphate isomerase [Corynebacterium freiburgense]